MEDFTDHTHMLEPEYWVYALYNGEALQYIGRTTCLRTRLGQHRRGVRFDRVMALECASFEQMSVLELELIAIYNPPLNTQKALSAPRPSKPVDLAALGFDPTRLKAARLPRMPRQSPLERRWRVLRRARHVG